MAYFDKIRELLQILFDLAQILMKRSQAARNSSHTINFYYFIGQTYKYFSA